MHPTIAKPEIENHSAPLAIPTAVQLNAFANPLTGHRMLFQPHELEAYRRLTTTLTNQYQPKTASETQILQRIIDAHMRLGRIAAIEGNILNSTLAAHTGPAGTPEEAATESTLAQSDAWLEHHRALERLSQYEARLSRQLLQYTKEMDRIQGIRRDRANARQMPAQPVKAKTLNYKTASFRQTPSQSDQPKVMTAAGPALVPAKAASRDSRQLLLRQNYLEGARRPLG